MDLNELKKKLFTMSEHEIYYRKHRDEYSEFYQQMSTIVVDGKEVCLFEFSNLAIAPPDPYNYNSKFYIVKHSRFSKVPLHIHDYVEMNYMYSGSCQVLIQDQLITLNKGDFCILDTNVPHTITNVQEKDIMINFLMQKDYFTTSMLARLSSNSIISNFLRSAISDGNLHNRYLIFHCQESKKITFFVENLLCDYYDPTFTTKDNINSYMLLLFSEMLQYYQQTTLNHNVDNSFETVRNILAFIEKNYLNCTLESTAKHFSFHPNYLSRYIKKHIGKSFKKLVQEQKLNKAAFLLVNTNFSIEEILIDVGYQNHAFFNQIFKKRYRLNPNEYRKQKRTQP